MAASISRSTTKISSRACLCVVSVVFVRLLGNTRVTRVFVLFHFRPGRGHGDRMEGHRQNKATRSVTRRITKRSVALRTALRTSSWSISLTTDALLTKATPVGVYESVCVRVVVWHMLRDARKRSRAVCVCLMFVFVCVCACAFSMTRHRRTSRRRPASLAGTCVSVYVCECLCVYSRCA